ncbi:MAG TPA: nucleotidyltransferase domain-containing protein [Bacteroidales bacterium]|nr:nucleotidyltransferase domain-containing protein [Bacteroidales bacterium]
MQSFGNRIRDLRKKKGDALRIVAAFLEIDQAILSKIEHGHRKASRTLVVKLEKYFNLSENDLILSWLSDNLVYEVKHEELALEALKVAEEKIAYLTIQQTSKKKILSKIISYFKQHTIVTKVWIFGSFARGEEDQKSDIDLLIEVPEKSAFSYFDLAEIQYQLKSALNRKVDIGFYEAVRNEIKRSIHQDLKLIYEKSG